MKTSNVMNTKDAVLGKFAEMFVTVGERRYKMLSATDFEGKFNVSTAEVPRVGSLIMGHKAVGASIEWSMTAYKVESIFADVVEEFLNTGVMPTFTIQVTNEDASSSVGRSTAIFTDCIVDGDILLAILKAEDDYFEQEISGFAENVEFPEKFTAPTYMMQ